MDNLGDILYIIAIIIAAIYGVFSSGKKKKRADEVLRQPDVDMHTEQESDEKGFWEIFEEMQQKPEPAPVYETPKTVPTHTSKKKENRRESRIKSKETVVDKKQQQAFMPGDLSSYQFATPEGTVLGEDENYMFNDESFHNLDELRKAIIYTEILNRKY